MKGVHLLNINEFLKRITFIFLASTVEHESKHEIKKPCQFQSYNYIVMNPSEFCESSCKETDQFQSHTILKINTQLQDAKNMFLVS